MLHLIFTALTMVTAVSSSRYQGQIPTIKGRAVPLTFKKVKNDIVKNVKNVNNVGLLLCKEQCLRTGGCKSLNYDRLQLKCQLLPYKIFSTNTLTQIIKGEKDICNQNNYPLSTLVITTRTQRQICIYTGFKLAVRTMKTKADEDKAPQYLSASSKHSYTYYGCCNGLLIKIERQGNEFEIRKIPAVTHCGSKENPNTKVRGMTTAPCLYNEKTFCLYYLLDKSIGQNGKLPRNLTLVYYEEPTEANGDENLLMHTRSTSLVCNTFTDDSSLHFTGVTFDSKLTVYTLHCNILYKFGRHGGNFSTCTFVRRIRDAGLMRSMAAYDDNHLLLITPNGLKSYDMRQMNNAGRTLVVFNIKRSALYCVDTREKRAVIVSADDLREVTLCHIMDSGTGCV